jgi:peptide deformylase
MQIVKAPDNRLRTKTKLVKKITPELLKLAKEMIDFASSFTDPEGVGLSTNQIGKTERFFVAKIGKNFSPFFNPEIHEFSPKKKVFFEGCLSIPDYYGETKRPISIKVSYQNEKGEKISKPMKGVSSWIFQHEVDHMNGVLFMDRVFEAKGKVYKHAGKDKTGSDIFEEIKII